MSRVLFQHSTLEGILHQPKTRLGLFFRNQITKVIGVPPIAKLAMGPSLFDRIDLPDYPVPENWSSLMQRRRAGASGSKSRTEADDICVRCLFHLLAKVSKWSTNEPEAIRGPSSGGRATQNRKPRAGCPSGPLAMQAQSNQGSYNPSAPRRR